MDRRENSGANNCRMRNGNGVLLSRQDGPEPNRDTREKSIDSLPSMRGGSRITKPTLEGLRLRRRDIVQSAPSPAAKIEVPKRFIDFGIKTQRRCGFDSSRGRARQND